MNNQRIIEIREIEKCIERVENENRNDLGESVFPTKRLGGLLLQRSSSTLSR